MPRKTKTTAAADQAAQPQIPADFLDQLVTGPMTAGQVQGLFDQFKKALLERALGAEMSHHLDQSTELKPPACKTAKDGAWCERGFWAENGRECVASSSARA